jgi:uroporphyrinogen III methyltransferase/synthase
LNTDLQPPEFVAESLADALAPLASGKRCLLARASRGREVLAERLRSAGAEVEQVVVYSSRDVQQVDPEIARRLGKGDFDWVTVTSSAIAASLARLFADDLNNARLVSISHITSATLAECGYRVGAEATVHTMDGIVEAILSADKSPHDG